MKKIEFFKQGLKDMKVVGAIIPTSKYASQAMIKHIDFQEAEMIVEYGAGDGVITKHILAAMRPNAKLLAFEINPVFCEKLREIKDDRLIVVEDSAEKLGEYLAKNGATETDFILSALPLVSLPNELGRRILATSKEYLATGGNYIQINYSLFAKKLYERTFGNVNVNFVPRNMPPAFISVSKKN